MIWTLSSELRNFDELDLLVLESQTPFLQPSSARARRITLYGMFRKFRCKRENVGIGAYKDPVDGVVRIIRQGKIEHIGAGR